MMRRQTQKTSGGLRGLPVRRRGFTLIELVMSLAILAIVLMAAESAILLASRAVPNGRSLPTLSVRSRQGLDGLNAELMFAKSVTELTARSITFTVADRTGDGLPETVRYAWSGRAGEPLTRQCQTDPTKAVTAATAATVVDNVYDFNLLYDRRQVIAPQTSSESAEIQLYANDPDPGLVGGLLGGGLADMRINSSTSVSQPFKPSSLPSAATGWRVTRVKYKAMSDGSAIGQYAVKVFPSSGGTPGTTAVDAVTCNESALGSSYAWQTATFTQTQTVPVGGEQAIGFSWVSDTVACDLQYQGSGLLGGVLGLVSSGSGSGGALCLYVYGTITTPDPQKYNYYLLNVRESLRIGGDSRSNIQAACRTLNEPQVTGP